MPTVVAPISGSNESQHTKKGLNCSAQRNQAEMYQELSEQLKDFYLELEFI